LTRFKLYSIIIIVGIVNLIFLRIHKANSIIIQSTVDNKINSIVNKNSKVKAERANNEVSDVNITIYPNSTIIL